VLAIGAQSGAGEGQKRPLKLALQIGWRLLLAAFIVMVAAAAWVRYSTAGYLYNDPAVIPARDVALVLGASVFRSGKPSPVVEARLRAALKLLESGKVQKILVSGAHKDDYDEADAMRSWLVHEGVTAAQIAVDQGGLRTLDSVVRAGGFFGAKSLVVCTQAFHLPRAVFLARRAGIDAVGLKVGANLADTGAYDLARESLATVRGVFDAQFLTARASP
jgi:SanA protein